MIVFVAGMPRAGSMWTYNVVRSIFEAKGYLVLPREVPSNQISQQAQIKIALGSEQKEREIYCIKTHLPLKSPLPTKHEVSVINNIRDVRDACLSFIRFMHADYDAGVTAMKDMMKITDYYLTHFGNNLLSVRYEEMTSMPMGVLGEICEFLNVDLLENEKKAILEKFDKSSIRKKLRELPEVKPDGRIAVETEQSTQFDAVKNRDGTYRTYEKATGFQSNHITSSGDGEWRTYFDRSQVEQLTDLSRDWLSRYGYEI